MILKNRCKTPIYKYSIIKLCKKAVEVKLMLIQTATYCVCKHLFFLKFSEVE